MAKAKSITIKTTEPDIDLDNRILRNVVFMTAAIARDGLMLLVDKMRTDMFLKDPQVLGRHQVNIGRAIDLVITKFDVMASVQFADNQLGRDLAYIYGVNEQKEVFARGWSGSADIVDDEIWEIKRAQKYLGDLYDEELIPRWILRSGQVRVVTRSVLEEFSTTPKRADIHALTRAFTEHKIETAGKIVREIQTIEAEELIAELQRQREIDQERITSIERDIKVLRGEEPSPAMLDDCEGIVRELKLLREAIKQ